MTLLVNVFTLDKAGKTEVLDSSPDGSDLGGHEAMRTLLWGSSSIRSIGARYLPELASGDLWVMPDRIESFLMECDLVQAHIPEISASTGLREDYITFRLNNMIKAAQRAKGLGGGVVVW